MRARKEVPVVRKFDGQDRLIILPGEDIEGTTAVGRPIGAEYFDISKKLQFMDTHNIGQSIISLANPWLDFLPSKEARDVAKRMNDESTNGLIRTGFSFLYFNLFLAVLVLASGRSVRFTRCQEASLRLWRPAYP